MSKSKMINCKHCGAEIAAKAKACPQCGGKNKPPFYKRGWFIALCVVVVIAVISCSGSKNTPTKVGDISSNSATSQPQQTRFTIGEKVALNDVVVTLKSVSQSSGGNYMTPQSGNVFLICEFEIENSSNHEIIVSSLVSFDTYVDDYSTSLSFSASASTDKPTLDGTVAAGKKISGILGYEVPKDWENLEINFAPDVWSDADIVFYATNN